MSSDDLLQEPSTSLRDFASSKVRCIQKRLQTSGFSLFIYEYDQKANVVGRDLDFGFTRRLQDLDTGLSYYRGRYCDTCNGVFTQVDPMRDGTNWHSYVNGNPVNRTDPTGYYDFYNVEANELISNSLKVNSTAKLIGKLWRVQDKLIDRITYVRANLDKCSRKIQHIDWVLAEVKKLLHSPTKVNVYGSQSFLSWIKSSQGNTYLGQISIYPKGENGGHGLDDVLFHESIHLLQQQGILHFESPLTETVPIGKDLFQDPEYKAYNFQFWLKRQ